MYTFSPTVTHLFILRNCIYYFNYTIVVFTAKSKYTAMSLCYDVEIEESKHESSKIKSQCCIATRSLLQSASVPSWIV